MNLKGYRIRNSLNAEQILKSFTMEFLIGPEMVHKIFVGGYCHPPKILPREKNPTPQISATPSSAPRGLWELVAASKVNYLTKN